MRGEGAAHPVDQRLIQALEHAFSRMSGADGRIDAAELQKALGLGSEYLARRVLLAFDRDRDGFVDRDEFLTGVRGLVFGGARDKLLFVFRLHDHDGDGHIERQELLRMLCLSLGEDQVNVPAQQVDRLANTLLVWADRDRDGKISFAEFEAAVRAHPEVLEQITRSEAQWIAPNEDLLGRLDEAAGERGKLARLVEERGGLALFFFVLWVAVNAALFVAAVLRHHERGANELVMIARGCGACLNFNGALILVPMLRRALTWLRTTRAARLIPVDDAVPFHRLVGHTMFGFGLVHTAAHLTNYAIGTRKPFVDQLFFTPAGVTGLLLIVFAGMWFFARETIRRSGRFELFYGTHLLYFAWFALALAHGPVFWIWAGVPLAGFLIEQALRAARRARSTEIIAGHALRSGVTRLEIRRPPGFAHRAGDYLFVRVPEVARHEWHPFTISSAPERENLTIHVRTLGNWTAALRRLVEQKHAAGSHAPLVAQVDGPYGAPSAHIFASRFAVLIGAGIGVTPFASVLESLVLRAWSGGGAPHSLQKVHFFWLNRDQYSFEWFAALLAQLEAIDRGRLLDLHICMTSGRTNVTAAIWNLSRSLLHAMGDRDQVTGLRTKTEMGHPDWERALRRIAEQHAPETVDVYFCGPHGLARKIQPICARLGMRFREEQF